MILLDLPTFLGRLHPLLVHLPIGFLLLAIAFHLLSYRRSYAYLNDAVPFTFLLAFLCAVFASLCGYMLSLSGDYDYQTLGNHKLAGLLLTVLSGLLWLMTTAWFRRLLVVPRSLFSALSMVSFVVLCYAGHMGASLTHGDDYISLETLWLREREKPTTVADAMIFEDIVQPILEARCVQCHRKTKRKGRLSMESLATMLKGGKSGPSVVPGDLAASELYRRVTLDPSDEAFMPADNKPPLTATETEIIRWWIEKGMGVEGKKMSELDDHSEIAAAAAAYLQLGDEPVQESIVLTSEQLNPNIPMSADTTLIDDLRARGLVVRLMFKNPLMLDVTLPPQSGINMADVADALAPAAKNIVWLNLSDNNLTEKDLGVISEMSNLEKLRLEKNPISDGIAGTLADLNYLEAVNLNETNITNDVVKALEKNPAIKRIYTWKTSVR